jgi:hypothetical protein
MLDYWRDNRILRLTIAGIILALLAPLLVGCGSGPTATVSPPSTDAPTASTAPTRASALTATAQPTRTPTAVPMVTATRISTFAPVPTSTAPSGTAVRASATATSSTGSTARFARGGLDGNALTALAVGGRDGQLLFAGGRGLWRSTDGGQQWEAVRSATEAPRVTAIAIAPSDQQVIYVGISDGCGRGSRTPGLVSTDGGTRWQESGQNITSLAVDPFDAKKLWATTCTGVQRSTDGGVSWEAAPQAQLDSYTPAQIALVPGTPRVVYAAYASEGGTAKVRRTIDDGATWQDTQLPAAAFGPLALATDPGKADTIFLSTLVGIFRSLDGGQSWTLLDAGLEATQPAPPLANAPDGFRLTTVIVAAPNVSDTFWVGTGAGTTKGIGVFGTRDGGATWRQTNSGIDGRTIQALAVGITSNRTILYAATNDGVWLLNTPQQ